MNISTFLVLMVVVVIVAFDIRYVMKNGVSSCSGDCSSGCHSSCRWVGDIKKAQRNIRIQNKIKSLLGLSNDVSIFTTLNGGKKWIIKRKY